MANCCGFCGGPGVTKEHLWSDWMRKVILESRAAGGQKHFQSEIERGGKAKRYKNPTLEQQIGMPYVGDQVRWFMPAQQAPKPAQTQPASAPRRPSFPENRVIKEGRDPQTVVKK